MAKLVWRGVVVREWACRFPACTACFMRTHVHLLLLPHAPAPAHTAGPALISRGTAEQLGLLGTKVFMELAEGSDCVLTVAVSDDASLVADGQLAATVRQLCSCWLACLQLECLAGLKAASCRALSPWLCWLPRECISTAVCLAALPACLPAGGAAAQPALRGGHQRGVQVGALPCGSFARRPPSSPACSE